MMKSLEAENAELRERLQMQNRMTMEEWMLSPQEIRDEMAARVLYKEKLNMKNALIRLGFVFMDEMGRLDKAEQTRLEVAKIIFNTPGCQEHMLRHLGKAEENQDYIVNRMQQIALHGEDGDSVRAAGVIGKFKGWQQQPDTVIDNRRMTLVQLLGNEKEPEAKAHEQLQGAVDADFFLCHEPGDPTVIDVGDNDALFWEAIMSCTTASYKDPSEVANGKRIFKKYFRMNCIVKWCEGCDAYHVSGDKNIDRYPFVKNWRTMLELVAEGISDRDAAKILGISPRMVEYYVEQITKYFYATNRANLVAITISLGLLNPNDFIPKIGEHHERTANV